MASLKLFDMPKSSWVFNFKLEGRCFFNIFIIVLLYAPPPPTITLSMQALFKTNLS